jgi:hypothetical protein
MGQIKNRAWRCEVDTDGSGQCSVVGTCKHGNETSNYKKKEDIF